MTLPKQISISLITPLLMVAVLFLPATGAWFRDGEDSRDNVLSSAILDATLTSMDADFLPVPIKAGEKASRLLTVRNVGNLPFVYQLKPDFGLQSNLLCSALTVTFKPINPLTDSLNPGLADEYVVEASLPVDAPLTLINQSCSFEIVLLALQPTHSPEKVGFWDEEGLSNQITSDDWKPDLCSDISGYKRDDAGVGLADWQIVIQPENRAAVETLTIMANDLDGEISTTNLNENNIYVVDIDNTPEADGEILMMDGLDVTGKTGLVLSDQKGKLLFSVKDAEETKDGGFIVRIYEVSDLVVSTDKDGYYLKELCEPGSYRILEVPQNGWEQMSPSTPSYYVTLPVSREYSFINKKKPVKILINEVFYDVDESHGSQDKINQSDEWVELYNPNDFPVNLKKWHITDDGENRTVSNRNVYIPALGFAFIVKGAETFKYWPEMPENAIRIELGQSLGDRLGNDGDRLILKDSLDNEVDFVSWGNDTSRWNPAVADVPQGHSIQRIKLGLDTDTISDWEDDQFPNPGTNPHTHFKVTTTQVENNLQIDFSNAVGFNRVKYALSYDRLNEEGELIPDKVDENEVTKPVTKLTLTLDPIYLGTCTTGGACVSHLGVTNGIVSLMYYYNDVQLGISTEPFSWIESP